jgi:methyltransferase (TIGR00027 family)
MIEARPSRTALRVAMHRAAHQAFDNPKVLDDPIALAIIGAEAAENLSAAQARYGEQIARNLRAFMAARSRFAEDELAAAVGRGVLQYVILGAGLDTFAYRNPRRENELRVFEVDYPATQEWKRGRLAAAGIPIPAAVTFAPVDFERQTLSDGLRVAGFDATRATFFSWLGVTMYLTERSVMSTLSFIASTPRGGGVVFDYAVTRSSLDPAGQMALDALSGRVAAAGEPFRTLFEPAALAQRLPYLGFSSVEDLGADEINLRYFKDGVDGLCVAGRLGRLMNATI